MSETGIANTSAFSLTRQAGMLSGTCTLLEFSVDSFL